jgi:hypothetical protein
MHDDDDDHNGKSSSVNAAGPTHAVQQCRSSGDSQQTQMRRRQRAQRSAA